MFRVRSLLLFVSFGTMRVSALLLLVGFAIGVGRKWFSFPVLPVSFGFASEWFVVMWAVVHWVFLWVFGWCSLLRYFGLWPLQPARLVWFGSV